MNRESLESLSKDALISLVLAQAEKNQALAKRVTELEAKLGLSWSPKLVPEAGPRN